MGRGPTLLQWRSSEPALEIGGLRSLESRCREAGLQPAAPPRVGPPSLVVSSHWKTASECSLGAPDSAQGYYCTCFGNAGLGGTDVRTVLPYWVTDESVNKFLIRAPGPHSRDADTAFLPEAWSFFLRSRAYLGVLWCFVHTGDPQPSLARGVAAAEVALLNLSAIWFGVSSQAKTGRRAVLIEICGHLPSLPTLRGVLFRG